MLEKTPGVSAHPFDRATKTATIDGRLRGTRFFSGLLLFYLVCGVGAVANVGMANWLFVRDSVWWIAGLAGAAVGAIWNYALSSSIVWRRK